MQRVSKVVHIIEDWLAVSLVWPSSLETLGKHLFLVCFDSCLMVNSDNQGKIS
jgi:hypothetical protein